MLTESIVRKTLGLKRFCVKEVKEKDGQLLMYLSGDKRYKLVCSRCGKKCQAMMDWPKGGGSTSQCGGFLWF